MLKAKTTNVMRAAASLHRNNAGIQTFQKVQQPVPLKALAVHDRACCVQSRKATNGFAQINAQYFNTHENAPLSTYACNNSCGFAGRQFIPIGHG